jgi:hypothetical protein
LLSGNASTYGLVELRLLVDGAAVRTLRTSVHNYLTGNQSSAWHLHTITTLTPGTHEISVDVRVIAASAAVQVNSTNGRLSALLFAQ